MATPGDLTWKTDLIWHYFGTVTTTAGPGRFNQYFKNQDPLGLLNNRRHVYDLLVGGTAESQPMSDAEVAKSTIPWNQNNEGFLKAVVVRITDQDGLHPLHGMEGRRAFAAAFDTGPQI
jgi:hypothetical protein